MDLPELIDPFARMLDAMCTPDAVRAVEGGRDAAAMWDAFAESGFLDALVAEEAGGAGLSLVEAAPLLALIGARAVPLPVGETLLGRALLTRAGQAPPDGPIALATGAGAVPLAMAADYVLSGTPEAPTVSSCAATATGLFHDLDGFVPDLEGTALRQLGAVLRAQLIAGAASRILEMTVAYANERLQFGKPIGKQQAVQQQLAVLAEQAVAARIAAAVGVRGGLLPTLHDAAVAKHATSVAAAEIAAIAHAVHGAIGISEEYELQLLTRRLHVWRLADGSESYWAGVLGELRIARATERTADFIRLANVDVTGAPA